MYPLLEHVACVLKPKDVLVRVLVVLHMPQLPQFFDVASDFLDQVVSVPNYRTHRISLFLNTGGESCTF